MHVILVYSYLQKCHLVPLADFQTYFFYLFIYRLTKHHSSILCWTYHMVYQHRNIMTLMYVFTHTYNIPFSTQQAAGNLPEEKLKQLTENYNFLERNYPLNKFPITFPQSERKL